MQLQKYMELIAVIVLLSLLLSIDSFAMFVGGGFGDMCSININEQNYGWVDTLQQTTFTFNPNSIAGNGNFIVTYVSPSPSKPVQAPALVVSLSPEISKVNTGSNDGSFTLTATASGGTPPYHYQWYMTNSPGTCSNGDTPVPNAKDYYQYASFASQSSQSSYYCVIVTDSSPEPQTASSSTVYVAVYPTNYLVFNGNTFSFTTSASDSDYPAQCQNQPLTPSLPATLGKVLLSCACQGGATYNPSTDSCTGGTWLASLPPGETCLFKLYKGPSPGSSTISCDGNTYTLVSTTKGTVYVNGFTGSNGQPGPEEAYVYTVNGNPGEYIVAYETPYKVKSTNAPTFQIGNAAISSEVLIPSNPSGPSSPSTPSTPSSPSTAVTVNTMPLVSSIIDYNNANAGGLITCPIPPNTLNTSEYFEQNIKGKDAQASGNLCIANGSTISNSMVFSACVTSHWSAGIPILGRASSTYKFNFTAPGSMFIYDYGFSPQAVVNTSPLLFSNLFPDYPTATTPYNISSSYNSNSYVFQSPSATAQKALWGWSAIYANFTTLGSKLQGGGKNNLLTATFSNKHETIIEPQYDGKGIVILSCVYPYTYTVALSINNIRAANIPIPAAIPLTSGNYFMFNGIKYPFVQQSTSYNNGESINNEYVSYACKNGGIYATYWGPNCYSSWNVFDYGTQYQTCAYQLFRGPPVGNDMIQCDDNTYTLVSNTIKGIVYYNGYSSTPVYAYYKGSDTGNYIVSYMTPYSTSNGAPTFAIGTASVPSIPFENVTALPYILYNFSMPSTMSDVSNKESYLNLSFDIYSPHNFLSPEYLDPFIINTSDGFFANYSGTLGELPFDSISAQSLNSSSFSSTPLTFFYTTVTNTLLNEQSSYFGPDFAKNIFGNNYGTLQGGPVGFIYSAISNPIDIESTPNDYVYVMTGSNDAVNVYVFRFIPAGYYNMSNYPPSSIPNVTSIIFSSSDVANALSQWTESWKNYWKEAMAIQSSDLYMIGVLRITSSAISGSFGSVPSIKLGFHFVPKAMAVDYANDLFFVGKTSSGNLAIGYILSNGTTGYDSNLHFAGSSDPIQLIPYDIAVSPGGDYIFITLSKYADSAKNISIFSARNFSFISNISLSYSTPEYNMSIIKYLEAGGPYPGNPGASTIASSYSSIASSYAGIAPLKKSQAVSIVSNDIEAYHNPIAMYDEDGILYVLDNWSFRISAPNNCEITDTGKICSYQLLPSSILMLRAFFANGTEVPIDAMYTSDIVPNSAYPGNIMLLSYPPYGWPLSATISVFQNNQVSNVTYCAVGNNGGNVGCDYTPNSIAANPTASTAYLPIGPEMHPTPSDKQNTKIYFGVNFNNTAYLWSSFSYIENGKSKAQNTLVAFKIGIINYTTLSFMQGMPYSCYVNASSPSSSTQKPSLQAYTAYNSNCLLSSALSSMSPPILGVPSSFLYTESQGSPEKYLTLPSVINSLHPFASSGSSYSEEANNINKTGCSGISAQKNTNTCSKEAETPANLATYHVSSTGAPSIPPEYINSVISGYLLLPYNLTYSFTQKWTYSNADSATGCSAGYLGTCKDLCYPGSVLDSSYTFNYVQYGTVQLNALNDSSNITIQSGSIYLANPTNLQDLYIPNISDASMIVPPRLAYTVLSNRLFGEIVINQSVNSTGNVLFPMKVLNQSNIYNYHIAQYTMQYDNGKTFNGFETEVAKYMEPVVTSPNTLSNPYYYTYDPNNPAYVYSYNHTLNYSNASLVNPGVFPQIYNTFSRMAYQYNLTLTFLSSNSLGYNRFIYTFIDMFNNTINVPIDVDLANQTQIFLNMTNVTINPNNPNQTTIHVGGYAMEYIPSNLYALTPLPKNSLIYIYYNNNINFANAFSQSGTFDPVQADLCAFSPYSVNCLLANPLNATESIGTNPWANNINYYPNYNITGKCPEEPKSMISNSIFESLFECNIYGKYGLPATETVNGHTRYCVPAFMNGTGTLTSQLGLVAILNTDANGYFSYTFNACGASIPKLIAVYYGWPPPEPAIYLQPPLDEAMETLNPSALVPIVPTQEYNYSYMPSQATYSVQIGSYALNFGLIYAPIAISLAAIAMALIVWHNSRKNNSIKSAKSGKKGKEHRQHKQMH